MVGRELLGVIIYNCIIVIICGNYVSLHLQNVHLRMVARPACCPVHTMGDSLGFLNAGLFKSHTADRVWRGEGL